MKFVTKWALAMALLTCAALPAAAQAQDNDRISVSITPAMVSMSGDSEFALAGTAGYRFTNHLSFESDITWINAAAGGFRNQRFNVDDRVNATSTINTVLQRTTAMFGGRNQLPNFNTPRGTIAPGLINIGNLSASTGGNTWIGTMGVRYEPTTQTARFRPYVSSGVGINYTRQQFTFDSTSVAQMIDQSASSSGLAFGAGGGANIRLGGPLWATADAKYFRLSRERDLMRIGGGITVKF